MGLPSCGRWDRAREPNYGGTPVAPMAPGSGSTATLAEKGESFKQEGQKTDRRSTDEVAGMDRLSMCTRVCTRAREDPFRRVPSDGRWDSRGAGGEKLAAGSRR